MLNSIDDIINLHTSTGNIEDAIKKIHIDNKVLPLNTFTLRVTRGNASKEEVRRWNVTINNEIKKDRSMQKEIREFVSIFRMFEKFVEDKQDEERINMCRVFRDPESKIFTDADRIKVLNDCIGNEELVTNMLRSRNATQ